MAFGQAQLGQGQRFYARINARTVVGKADEPVRPDQMAANLSIQPVHVIGAVKRAPLHRQNQNRVGHKANHQKIADSLKFTLRGSP